MCAMSGTSAAGKDHQFASHCFSILKRLTHSIRCHHPQFVQDNCVSKWLGMNESRQSKEWIRWSSCTHNSWQFLGGAQDSGEFSMHMTCCSVLRGIPLQVRSLEREKSNESESINHWVVGCCMQCSSSWFAPWWGIEHTTVLLCSQFLPHRQGLWFLLWVPREGVSESAWS